MPRPIKTDMRRAKDAVAKRRGAESFSEVICDFSGFSDAPEALEKLAEELAELYASYYIKKSTGPAGRIMEVRFFKSSGLWFWKAIQSNGRSVAIQGEGLKNKSDSKKSFTNFINKLKAGLWKLK